VRLDFAVFGDDGPKPHRAQRTDAEAERVPAGE
jgi:hypothetical protein